MTIGGLCAYCGRFFPALYTCKSCGSRVCPNDVMEGTLWCKICKGRRTIETDREKFQARK